MINSQPILGVRVQPPPKYNWLLRYKVYHLPFWVAYHGLWWTLTIGSVGEVVQLIFSTPYAIKFFFYVIFQALGVYANLYYLIPRFLEKGRYGPYLGLLTLTIIGVAAALVTGYYLSAWWAGRTVQALYDVEPGNYFHFFTTNTLSSTVASMTLAMSVKLTKNWLQATRRQQVLEKEKLETELKFLKAQINPHFLFNTINSIFVLIRKNPALASASLATFSELLRYQLYECNESQILLDQELTYLTNYMELEKLRQESEHMDLTLQVDPPLPGNLTIAPFLLMPFVENAFKHVSKEKTQHNWIRLHLRCDENDLHFVLANSHSPRGSSARAVPDQGGIGLVNVQRRLDLLYPGRHQLLIQASDDQFEVRLRLSLQHRSVGQAVALSVS